MARLLRIASLNRALFSAQGTAAVVLASLIGALKFVGGILADHTFLFLGAGELNLIYYSHNMLQLLHKVDQSRNNNIVTHFSFSDNNAPLEMPEEVASIGSACLRQDHSSALQGFGLKLAPPSQQQLVLDHDLPLQASIQTTNDFSSRYLDSNAGNKVNSYHLRDHYLLCPVKCLLSSSAAQSSATSSMPTKISCPTSSLVRLKELIHHR